MTIKQASQLCFAYNTSIKKCRCLKETDCKNGFGENCKFYKPRDNEENNQKMREFLKTSSKAYKSGKYGGKNETV